MKTRFTQINGSIIAPRGFLASGVFCDIKRLGTGKGSEKGAKRDLALIVSQVPATVAGMFTTNQICAAPVKVCIERVKKGVAQAIVVNSGNANACTGKVGLRDAVEMTAALGEALRIPEEQVLVGSTGRIGVRLPMANVKAGILVAVAQLGDSPECADHAAEAIITSDTRTKQIALRFTLGGKPVCVGGICKGAGMIQPVLNATGQRPASVSSAAGRRGLPNRGGPARHATMLCFIATDAAIDGKLLQAALEEAVARSFNCITVDGDMSTNDTVLVLANGLAQNPKSELRNPKSKDARTFRAALNHVCLELARMIVRDGEGVSRVVTVRLAGARSPAEAEAAARAVANSALVKTSWSGGDPNWGRIIDALGYSSAKVVEANVDIGYSAPGKRRILWSLKRGQPTKASFKELCAAVAPKEFDLHINLNLAAAGAVIYAADLTEQYVEFNKGDVSDPASLGG
jgi:glutamate N-acetyltransferase/amino-acid N-acetyltransferase